MYKNIFDLKERRFQLVPNSTYLRAFSKGDGFVEIIGKQGTGKEKLCWVFLESLFKNIEVAK